MHCEFDPPVLQLKLLKRDNYVLVLPRKNAPVYQCVTLDTFKNLVCHVWWALQYLALWAANRNKLIVCPTPNGQSPSASLNKKIPLSPYPHQLDSPLTLEIPQVLQWTMCIQLAYNYYQLSYSVSLSVRTSRIRVRPITSIEVGF